MDAQQLPGSPQAPAAAIVAVARFAEYLLASGLLPVPKSKPSWPPCPRLATGTHGRSPWNWCVCKS